MRTVLVTDGAWSRGNIGLTLQRDNQGDCFAWGERGEGEGLGYDANKLAGTYSSARCITTEAITSTTTTTPPTIEARNTKSRRWCLISEVT